MIAQFAELTRAYLEPHRHYHTLDHIIRMLNTIRDHKLDATKGLFGHLLSTHIKLRS